MLRFENVFPNIKKFTCAASTLINLDASAYIKYSLTFGMCPNVLQTMGTERHLSLAEKANNSEVRLCRITFYFSKLELLKH